MHPRFAEYVRRDPDEGIVISELLQEDIDEEQTRRDLSLADIIKNIVLDTKETQVSAATRLPNFPGRVLRIRMSGFLSGNGVEPRSLQVTLYLDMFRTSTPRGIIM